METQHERAVKARIMRRIRCTVLYKNGISNAELKSFNLAMVVASCILACFLMALIVSVASADCSGPCRDIAVTLAGEAAGEGESGMRAVGSTIHNRAKAWGKTPHQIATAKNQYYGFTAKNRLVRYKEVKPIADRIALELMSGNFKDTVRGGLYFRTQTEPVFRWCKVKTASVGRHIFYR